MKKVILTLLAGILVGGICSGQSVRIDSIYSSILKKKIPTTIILPTNYDTTK